MTGAITWEQFAFFIGLLATVAGVWWRVEGKINTAKDKADGVSADLAAYKLHVSETYSTKSGMKEIKDEILSAVSGIRDDVRHLGTRIDAMHEANNKPRQRRPAE
jgi:prophage DNA circulation protein